MQFSELHGSQQQEILIKMLSDHAGLPVERTSPIPVEWLELHGVPKDGLVTLFEDMEREGLLYYGGIMGRRTDVDDTRFVMYNPRKENMKAWLATHGSSVWQTK